MEKPTPRPQRGFMDSGIRSRCAPSPEPRSPRRSTCTKSEFVLCRITFKSSEPVISSTSAARAKSIWTAHAQFCRSWHVPVSRDIRFALLDAREVQASLTWTNLYKLAQTFKEMGFRQEHGLAILHRYQAIQRAEFFARCAEDRGWH